MRVEGVAADKDLVVLPFALEIDGPHEVEQMQLVGPPCLRCGVDLLGQEPCEPHAGRGDTVAFQDALDRALAG